MIEIAALCASADEQDCIRNALAEIAIRRDWADGLLRFVTTIDGLRGIASEKPDIILFDAGIPKISGVMAGLRSQLPETLFLPIADDSVPPTDYVRPDIIPFSLIWRPMDRNRVKQSLLAALLRIRERDNSEKDYFILKSKSQYQRIPYNRICYFEAVDKKISIRVPDEEYRFYGTLATIETQLPEQFLRCHKSFIVNRDRVQDVRYDVQTIHLDCSLEIPYSKGYRKSFLEKCYGRND